MSFVTIPYVRLKDFFKREKSLAVAEAEEHRKARKANAKKKDTDDSFGGDDIIGGYMPGTSAQMA
jgi:hypothetical protein